MGNSVRTAISHGQLNSTETILTLQLKQKTTQIVDDG